MSRRKLWASALLSALSSYGWMLGIAYAHWRDRREFEAMKRTRVNAWVGMEEN